MLHLTSITFSNFKSFKRYSVSLSEFNILVGANNAGKSTIIGSLKLLAEGIRMANAKKPITVKGPDGSDVLGYHIDLRDVPVATDNVFHNYDETVPAIIKYRLSDGSYLQVFFPRKGTCYMNYISDKVFVRSPSEFKRHVKFSIGYVPVLGPVEYEEQFYQKEAARQALLTHRASRNFRNIWYHYPEDFTEFRSLIQRTWPGMDIDAPEINNSTKKPTLNMFCPEERIPREIFWTGFGFQIWCQLLTFTIQNSSASLFLIDEPDIYLHSDLQRQLIGILKNLGPDIVIATHSTEIISEAELNDILLVKRGERSAQRIKDPAQLKNIFSALGSNLNPILTQVAKSRRVVFVEGKDFGLLSKFARIMEYDKVASRSNFAVVPVGGFNPNKLRAFKEGIELTVGVSISSLVIFDRDYRSSNEIQVLKSDLEKFNDFVFILDSKEIENYLLNPKALEKAINKRILNIERRTGNKIVFDESVEEILGVISERYKHDVFSQLQSNHLTYSRSSGRDQSELLREVNESFERLWSSQETILKIVPGKDFLANLNTYLQENYGITISVSSIIDEFDKQDLPGELLSILNTIKDFAN